MKTYMLKFEIFTGGLAWEYKTELSSDTMAKEWAMRIAQDEADGMLRRATALLLFNMSDQKLIGRFV